MKLTTLTPILAAASWLAFVPQSAATPFDFFQIEKTAFFFQDSPLAPTTTSNWLFSAHFCCTEPGEVTALTVETPSGQILEASGDIVYFITSNFTSSAALDATFHPGDYTFTAVEGTLAPTSAVVTVPPLSLYPSTVPFFTGTTFERWAAYDPSLPFTFTWNQLPPNPAATVQFVSLTIYPDLPGYNQPVFNSISLAVAGFTSATVPAGTLSLNTAYRAVLYFSNQQIKTDAGFGNFKAVAAACYSTEVKFSTQVPPEASSAIHAIYNLKGRQKIIGDGKVTHNGRKGFLVYEPDTSRATEIVALVLNRTNKVYAIVPLEDYIVKQIDGRKGRTHTIIANAVVPETPVGGTLLQAAYLRGRNNPVTLATGEDRRFPRIFAGLGREIIQDEGTGATVAAEIRHGFTLNAKASVQSNDAAETFDATVARLASTFEAKGYHQIMP